jgi:hypothetical protein
MENISEKYKTTGGIGIMLMFYIFFCVACVSNDRFYFLNVVKYAVIFLFWISIFCFNYFIVNNKHKENEYHDYEQLTQLNKIYVRLFDLLNYGHLMCALVIWMLVSSHLVSYFVLLCSY